MQTREAPRQADRRLCGGWRREGTKKQDSEREETHAHRSTPIPIRRPSLSSEIITIYG